jgi:hypothetical protein
LEAIAHDDLVVSDVRTPIIDCTPLQARVADASSSSFDSQVMRELITQLAALNKEM